MGRAANRKWIKRAGLYRAAQSASIRQDVAYDEVERIQRLFSHQLKFWRALRTLWRLDRALEHSA